MIIVKVISKNVFSIFTNPNFQFLNYFTLLLFVGNPFKFIHDPSNLLLSSCTYTTNTVIHSKSGNPLDFNPDEFAKRVN